MSSIIGTTTTVRVVLSRVFPCLTLCVALLWPHAAQADARHRLECQSRQGRAGGVSGASGQRPRRSADVRDDARGYPRCAKSH